MIRFAIFACSLISSVLSFSPTVSTLPSSALVGAKPIWDDESNSLYYADYYGDSIFRYSYEENKTYRATIPSANIIGFVIPIDGEEGRFVVGMGRTAGIIQWDGQSSRATREEDLFNISSNANLLGVAIGANNEIFAGGLSHTFCGAPANLSFYEYADDLRSISKRFKSNTGIEINEKRNILYHLDSCTKTILGYDYNSQNGDLTNKRVIYKLDVARDVYPIGLALDVWGNLYTGLYGGGAVAKINPTLGKLVDEIKVPTKYVTSPTFGGPKHDTLFVTSSNLYVNFRTGVTERTLKRPAGDVFMIRSLLLKGIIPRKPRNF